MAGPDDRSPISYDVDPRELRDGREGAVGQGLARSRGRRTSTGSSPSTTRCARSSSAPSACSARSARGSRPRVPTCATCRRSCDSTRGLLMVARHADKLPEHRAILQEGPRREHGAGARAVVARGGARRAPAHAAVGARARVPRDARPARHADDARRRRSRSTSRTCSMVNGQPRGQGDAAVVPHLRVLGAGAAGDLDPVRVHARRPAGRPADRRQAARRSRGAARGGGVRGRAAVGGPQAARRAVSGG